LSQSPSRSELALFEKFERYMRASFRRPILSASSGIRHPQAIRASAQTSNAASGTNMIAIIAALCCSSSPANCHVEQPTISGPIRSRLLSGHCLTDRRRLTYRRIRLLAQVCPVITRANNSKLPTTTTARDQPEPNQPFKCISNGRRHSKQHHEAARFCCLLGVTFQSLTRLTGISH